MQLIAVKSGTKALARVEGNLIFEPLKVFDVQPGFITVNDLRKCRTMEQVDALFRKFAIPLEITVIIDGSKVVGLCEAGTVVHIINKDLVKQGICPICKSTLENSFCPTDKLDWHTVTNDEIADKASTNYIKV